MKLRSYDFRCRTCDCDFDAIVEILEEVDAEGITTIECRIPECLRCHSADVIRVPSAPSILKASFPDGRKRQDSWYIGKEAADIRKSGFGKNPKKRDETERQAKNLEKEAHKRFNPERQ